MYYNQNYLVKNRWLGNTLGSYEDITSPPHKNAYK